MRLSTWKEDRFWLAMIGLCLIATCFIEPVLGAVEGTAQDTPVEATVTPRPYQEHAPWRELCGLPAVTQEPEEDPNEAALIEAALVEQGYFRDDLPLTFEEQDYLHTACEEFAVEYEVMLGLIERETNFHNVTGDSCRSYGYCQIQPKWWSGLMEEIGAEDLMAPYDNFRTACAILSRLIAKYGNLEDALTYYNSGHTGTSAYARGVLANAEKYR